MYIASTATKLKFHEFPSGNLVNTYKPTSINKNSEPKSIKSISWCKDGSWLGLVPTNGSIEIISVKDQLKLLQTIRDITEPNCIAFQNNTKKNIAIGTKNGRILIYDIKSRNIKKKYPPITSSFNQIEFTAKDTHLIASDDNSNVYVYSNLTNDISSIYKVSESTITTLRTNPIKRNYVIGGNMNGYVIVWDTNLNKHVFLMNGHKAPVSSVAFSPINSELVLSTGLDRQFCFYDVTSNKCIATVPVDNNMTCCDFSMDGSSFLFGSQNGKISIFDSRRIQEPVELFQAHNTSIKCLSLQKVQESSTVNSFYEISSAAMDSQKEKKVRPTISLTPTTPTPATTSHKTDSFNLTINTISPALQFSSNPSTDIVDSFLTAMQLNTQSPLADSKKESYEAGKQTLQKTPSLIKTMKIDEKIFDDKLCQKSSTPKYVLEDLILPTSPITKQLTPVQPIQEVEVNKTNEMVTSNSKTLENSDDLKKMLTDFKSEMNSSLVRQFGEIRSLYYRMHLANVKQFIKIDNNFEMLRDELVQSEQLNSNEVALLQENLFLRQKVALLEEELSQLRN